MLQLYHVIYHDASLFRHLFIRCCDTKFNGKLMIRVSQSSNNLQIEIFLILSHARLAFFFPRNSTQTSTPTDERNYYWLVDCLFHALLYSSLPHNLIHAANNGKGLLSSREEKGEQVRESKRYKMCLDVHSGSLST